MARVIKNTGNRGRKKQENANKNNLRIFASLDNFMKSCLEHKRELVTAQEAAHRLKVTRACVGNWALTRYKVRAFRYQTEWDKNGILLVDWEDCKLVASPPEAEPEEGQIPLVSADVEQKQKEEK